MKKAKMILAAIAVFAIVGGVYATKATKRGAILYCADQLDVYGTTTTGFTIAPSGLKNSYCTATTTTFVTYTRVVPQP